MDEARLGRSSRRRVVLLKVPRSLMETWMPLFRREDAELFRCAEFRNGAILSTQNGRYRVNVTPTRTPKSRLISSDVGTRGENVRFEGIVEATASLVPHLDPLQPEYVETVTERTIEADTCTREIQRISHTDIARHHAQIVAADPIETSVETETVTETAEPDTPRKRRKTESITEDDVRKRLLECFTMVDRATGIKREQWRQKDLRNYLGIPLWKFKPVLDQIAEYKNGTYSLKV